MLFITELSLCNCCSVFCLLHSGLLLLYTGIIATLLGIPSNFVKCFQQFVFIFYAHIYLLFMCLSVFHFFMTFCNSSIVMLLFTLDGALAHKRVTFLSFHYFFPRLCFGFYHYFFHPISLHFTYFFAFILFLYINIISYCSYCPLSMIIFRPKFLRTLCLSLSLSVLLTYNYVLAVSNANSYSFWLREGSDQVLFLFFSPV